MYGATSVPNINTFCGFINLPAGFYPFCPKYFHILKIVSNTFLSYYDIFNNYKSKILFAALFKKGIVGFYNPIVLNNYRTAPFDSESIPSTRYNSTQFLRYSPSLLKKNMSASLVVSAFFVTYILSYSISRLPY